MLKDLGKVDKMYDHPTSVEPGNKKRYPNASLPSDLFSDDIKVGDEKTLTVKVKVTGIVKNEYRNEVDVDLKEAEIKTEKKNA